MTTIVVNSLPQDMTNARARAEFGYSVAIFGMLACVLLVVLTPVVT